MVSDPPGYRFTAGRWVQKDHFLGREALLGDIWRCLTTPELSQSRRFLGRRRQGKTSLLHAVGHLAQVLNDPELISAAPPAETQGERHDLLSFAAAHMAARQGRAVSQKLVPAYIDLRVNRQTSDLAARLARAVQKALGRPGLAARVRGGRDPMGALMDLLVEEHATSPFTLLVLADEARSLAPSPEELEGDPKLEQSVHQVTEALQALVDQADVPVQLYMASTRTLDWRAEGALRVLLDSIPVFPLGNLGPDAVQVMLRRSGLPPKRAAHIAARSGGNPFFLHVLGFSEQNPGASAAPQIEAGIENDVQHLKPEELSWMTQLSRGVQGTAPEAVELLSRCDYVRRSEQGWVMKEPLFAEGLTSRAQTPPAPAPLRRSPARLTLELRTYQRPSRQHFGELRLGDLDPLNLGIQRYVLLHLLASGAEQARGFQQSDLRYPLFLSLALCGTVHGALNPRRVLSGVRAAVDELAERAKLDLDRGWLPSGRGGYQLGDPVKVLRNDPPLAHRGLGELDLTAVYRRWEAGRAAFNQFLKESVIEQKPGRSIELKLQRAAIGLFPRHMAVMHLRVRDNRDDSLLVNIGPVPLIDEEVLAFGHWQQAHMDDGWIRPSALARGTIDPALSGLTVEAISAPFELLELRGLVFSKGQQRWSSEWLPRPGSSQDFPTAPPWLDLHHLDEREGPVFEAGELAP